MDDRLSSLKNWLQQYYADDHFTLQPLSGDASFRRYFRVERKGHKHLAVDMPPAKENIGAFVDMTTRLADAGLCVPSIHHCSMDDGFLLIDDLGDKLLSTQVNAGNADALYRRTIDELVRVQAIEAQTLPIYNTTSIVDEARIFTEWYCIVHLGMDLNDQQIAQLESVYHYLASVMITQPRVFVHRDYHSRNLICLKQGGIALIDYQDAVWGAVTYDLVSLLKDCYIKWPREQQLQWLEYYLSKAGLAVDTAQFIRWFDLTGVQRHLKAAGIFARLHHRDGKDTYLNDIPRTLSYISDLQEDYPELDNLQHFISGLNL